ncbi:thymidylate synthase [Pseudomonas phage Noxifer]|uniref:thymidylate synthase n=1 Tax=Pseudomonas phage Noxifer TaxID=2006684 RepID=A0A1Y0SV64_9CAUD|nr:thymidylate synthase [Pseudomonas phage Noxifer]ARV77412.1 putative thymidylate synthase [Pseudomonas phage Noxifer]
MRQYLDFLRYILETGEEKDDRTGVGTISKFGYQMRFDVSGFKAPWVTTKFSHPKSIVSELLDLLIAGTDEIDGMAAENVTIWDEWVKDKTRVYVDLNVAERMGRVKKAATQAAFDAFRDTLYSAEEVEGWEYMPASNRWRAPNVDATLHAWIDEHTKVPRRKLVKGSLGPVYGVQWRQWPVLRETRALSHRSAARFVEAVGKLDELRARFENEFMLDEWLMKAKASVLLDTEVPADAVVAQWLNEHGYVLTEQVTVKSIDQLARAVEKLKNDPNSRSIMVSAWNPADLADMALEPCHSFFQLYSNNLNKQQLVGVILRSPLLRVAKQVLPLEYNPEETFVRYTENVMARNEDGTLQTIRDSKFGPLRVVVEHQIGDVVMDHEGKAMVVDTDEEALMRLDVAELREFAEKYELPTRGLSLQMYQRSADAFLGVPFNISSYSLLTKLLAQVVNFEPLEFIWTGGDCHIYKNHIEQVREQLTRKPKPGPAVFISNDVTDIDQFKASDITLVDYEYHPHIAGKVAV